MKTTSQTIRSTIIYGLVSGLSFIPLSGGLGYVVFWPEALYLTLWIHISVYSILLTRWSGRRLSSIIFPLVPVFAIIFWADSISLFLVLILSTFSWIRSGICFPEHAGRKIISELVLSLGTVSLVITLTPASALGWSLTIWMFFLIQALYFVMYETECNPQETIQLDPFEKAREQAENILSSEVRS
jgi:hypothetical protein